MSMDHAAWVEIKAKVDLYGFAVDTLRWDLFDRIFVDRDLDIIYATGAWTDREQLKTDFHDYHKDLIGTQHVMTNFVCDVSGNSASGVTYGHWLLLRPDGSSFRGQGWYEDVFRRETDGWKIQRRHPHVIWHEGQVLTTSGKDAGKRNKSLHDSAHAAAMMR